MTKFRKSLALGVSITALVSLAGASQVLAQVAELDEVVVTSRRAEERLQDVPLAITAMTAEQMAARGVNDLEGIARYTPAMEFSDFVTTFNGSVTMRGLAQTNIQNAVGNVGTFMNGIYLQRGYMLDVSQGDFARIEVVKGPQSALYGQNTFSGAINFITTEPSWDYKADATVNVGAYGLREANVGVGGPIVDGLVAGRLYLSRAQYGGSWKNNLPGAKGENKRFGGYDREAWSAALKFTPTDNLTFDLFYQELDRAEELRPFYAIDGNFVEDRLNCGPLSTITGRPSLYCGYFPTDSAGFRTGVGARPSEVFAVEQPWTTSHTELFKVGATWDISDSLSAYYVFGSVEGRAQEDQGFPTNSFNPTGRATVTQQKEGGILVYSSHDLRLAWDNGGPLRLDGGYFHSRAKDSFLFGLRFVPPGRAFVRDTTDPLVAVGYIISANAVTTYETDSVYARAALELMDGRLTASAEARYTMTDLVMDDKLSRGANPSLPLLEDSFKNVTPRFSVDYKLTDKNLLYVTAAKGVKNGGFNGYRVGTVVLLPDEQSYGEEENWTYELGSKNTFLDGRVILNADVFYVDWTNRQQGILPANYPTGTLLSGQVPASGVYGAIGNVTSLGVELDGQFRVTDNLTLRGSYAYVRAEYGDDSIDLGWVNTCDNIICARDGDVSGHPLAGVPKHTGAASAEWNAPLTGFDGWSYFAGLDVTYKGKRPLDSMGVTGLKEYVLTDARIGVENDTWRLFAWAKNLMDEKYLQSAFAIVPIRTYAPAYGERRQVGVTLNANF